MSADNYYLIRFYRGRFVVSMGFASDEPPGVHKHDPRFDDFDSAVVYATRQYSEYGVRIHKSAYKQLDIRTVVNVDGR